ncbi:MAG: hypothetical protein R3222_04550 [Balneolaceae bacterium]|nr:hypothetical protein [Balneolaceae bacterium]
MRSSRANLLYSLLAFLLLFTACDSSLNAPQKSVEGDEAVNQKTVGNSPVKANVNKALAKVRSANAMYQDVRKAVADGYAQFSIHVPNMGIHYVHDSAIGENGSSVLDNKLDPLNPEVLVYVEDNANSSQRRLVAAEYAIPKETEDPPANAMELFPGLGEDAWHVHPSTHGLPLSDNWTIHGECHYQGGLGVFLAENPDDKFVFWTPPTGAFGSWSGTIDPLECPKTLGGTELPPLLIAHGKWWTLHTWAWYPNPEGVFHATNPRVGSGS